MARGKHGQAATVRREHQEVQGEIVTYQRNIKRLTAENRELREKLQAEQSGRLEDIRALRAQLHEGLTPELRALHRQLDQQTERAAKAKSDRAYVSKRLDQLVRRTERMLVDHFEVPKNVALGVIVHLIPDDEHRDLALRVLKVPKSVLRQWEKQSGGPDGSVTILNAQGETRGLANSRNRELYRAATAIRTNDEAESA